MKPAGFILDLLRTYGKKGTTARSLMAAGEMFSYSDNQLRVTLSRLVARGLVEKISRGTYRLAEQSDPVSDFVEEWRLGESRRSPWQDRFLLVHTDAEDERSAWCLDALGFRLVRKHLWGRADNLSKTASELSTLLKNLGLAGDFLVIEQAAFSAQESAKLFASYDIEALNESYLDVISRLKKSEQKLPGMPHEEAMRETFRLGGEALQVLAKDPLLPEEIMPSTHRQHLHEVMLSYDKTGRDIWASESTPDNLPAEMAAYA